MSATTRRPWSKRSRAVAKRLNDGVGFLMKKNKVSVIWGEAAIDAPGKVTVKASKNEAPKGALGAGSYQAKHIIIATGARPRVLPGLEPDKKLVWTYFEAMVPPSIPKSLLVIGSGAIGIEFASFYRTLGAEVTVVEVLPQILPVEDHEIQTFRAQELREAGHQDPDQRQGDQARQESRQRHRDHRRGRQDADHHRRARDLRRRRDRQYRESRAGKARRQNRARLRRGRSVQQDQRAGHLRHRRRRRPADAGAQGRARGRGLHRGDQGPHIRIR